MKYDQFSKISTRLVYSLIVLINILVSDLLAAETDSSTSSVKADTTNLNKNGNVKAKVLTPPKKVKAAPKKDQLVFSNSSNTKVKSDRGELISNDGINALPNMNKELMKRKGTGDKTVELNEDESALSLMSDSVEIVGGNGRFKIKGQGDGGFKRSRQTIFKGSYGSRNKVYISGRYQAGKYLVYDCYDGHFGCVSRVSYNNCRFDRELAFRRNYESLPCAPLKKFENEKLCKYYQFKSIALQTSEKKKIACGITVKNNEKRVPFDGKYEKKEFIY
jgi:hypothetical protein